MNPQKCVGPTVEGVSQSAGLDNLGPRGSRTLVPKTILLMVFGIRDLKYWVVGSSGSGIDSRTQRPRAVEKSCRGGTRCFGVRSTSQESGL